jgi:nitroreductase
MEFFEAIHARQSVRKFRQEAIPDEIITRLLEAIRTAPTAGNLQAYHVYLVQSPEMIRALADAAFGQECVTNAPCVLVFCTDAPRSAVKYKERGSTLYRIQDATIAATVGHLAATALGLGSVMVGAFREDRAAGIIGANPAHRPLLMLPVGFAAETPVPTERRALPDMVSRC